MLVAIAPGGRGAQSRSPSAPQVLLSDAGCGPDSAGSGSGVGPPGARCLTKCSSCPVLPGSAPCPPGLFTAGRLCAHQAERRDVGVVPPGNTFKSYSSKTKCFSSASDRRFYIRHPGHGKKI